MFVTIKSKDGYPVDVTGIYIMALEGSISKEEYVEKLDSIANRNKNI